ncbi:MAG: hypothetical protein LUG96_10280 [Tannerellaceae bacterium]|nr:hypothetical protein [Tannerellaceae bacterium]
MNKKFSTFFMACMFLLGTVSAYAQTVVPKLVRGDNEGLYQLRVGSGAGDAADSRVLAIDKDGIIRAVDVRATSTELSDLGINLAHTFWCMHVTQTAQGVPATFEFLNKVTGQYLSVTMQGIGGTTSNMNTVIQKGEVESNVEIYNWSFSDGVFADALVPDQLISFYQDDYVVGFVVDPADFEVGIKKMYKTDVVNGVDYTVFTLQEARIIVLDELDFNTILAYQDEEDGVELVFDPTITNNPFLSHGSLYAEQSDLTDYLYIRDENNNFLMVDTSYINTIGTDYLGYKWVDLSKKQDPIYFLNNDDNFIGQYKSKFTYSPSTNDLEIQVRESSYKLDNRPNWISWINGANVNTYTIVYDRYIRVQDYGTEGYNLTVSERDGTTAAQLNQNVKVGFVEFAGCAVANDKTSLPTDLYVITDGNGKYLAAPLKQTNWNENGGTTNANTRIAQWVTLERNENPWTMPGYQWVVKKTQTATTLQPTSPIKITNREYKNIVVATNLQLYVDSERTLEGVGVTTDNFVRDTEGVKANPYVGYRHFDKDSLLIAGFTFKYLHEAITDNLYLSIGGLESDSVIYAGQKVVFTIDTIPTEFLGNGNGNNTLAEDTILVILQQEQ